MAARAQADQRGYLRDPRPAMMDGDRALPCGGPGTELAGVAIPGKHLGAQSGEVARIPAAPGIAAGAVTADQLALLGAKAAPQGLLSLADGSLQVEISGRTKTSQGASLRTAEMLLHRE